MNKESEGAILEAVVAALNDLGLNARARQLSGKTSHGDAVVTLRHDGNTLQYRAEARRRLTPSLIGPIALAFSEPAEHRLLITDYATPPIADALRLRGVQFADAAGNAFLNRDGVFIVVTGRTPKNAPPRTNTLRVFRRSGLQILFVLLSAPTLVTAPHRTIAETANVALGSVTPLLEGLRELGFLIEVRGTRRLVDRPRLIDQWTEGYARVLEPSLEIGRFRAHDGGWWRQTDPTKYGVQWGGETAAAFLHRDLRPEQVIVYTDDLPARLLTDKRIKADTAGNVVLRRRFWNAVPSPNAEVVPPLLIYADLLATGDARSVAAAKQIRETYLD
jgi:hypothetical protein